MLRESGMRSQGAIEQPSPGAREQRREANEAQKKAARRSAPLKGGGGSPQPGMGSHVRASHESRQLSQGRKG